MKRYPANISISIMDFENCGWLEAIDTAKDDDYSSMWQSLSRAAEQAIEQGRLSEGRVLWLLADACSLRLKPSSVNEPFAPIMVMGGERSALPEDYQADEIAFITEIYSEISEPKLSARISDLAWLLVRPKSQNYALSAIESYRKVPVTTNSWVREGSECWERAIQLCLMIGSAATEQLRGIEQTLIDSLNNSTITDGYLALWISEILARHRLGHGHKESLSNKLEMLAKQSEGEGELHRARDYFDAAGEWYKRSKNTEKHVEMLVSCAEGWVTEATARLSSDSPSHMVAASFYENAIQKYRSIPKAYRNTHNVDARVDQLRGLMNEAGERSLSEMAVISSEPIDISDLINNSRTSVTQKSSLEALFALANIYAGAQEHKIRQFSQNMISRFPLQSLFSSTHMSRDGRVIAKRSGANLSDGDNDETLWSEMVKYYIMELGIIVQGQIWPGLEVIRLEHRLKEGDFLEIVRRSPIVPPSGKTLMAKALFLGYDNDFISALHILVPQLENLVRYHLKQSSVKTTTLDINGIELETGLSSLMEKSEAKIIFGADLHFEISALFCDPFGPNLRNELAHGLLGVDDCNSTYSIYAWWLMLHIVFNTFWNTHHKQDAPSSTPDVGTSSDPG